MDTKLDVIVVNYRTPEDLREFGESFLAQDFPARLVIVNVDPLDEDEAVAQTILQEAPANSMYIHFGWNCGYATAVNRGASLTDSPVLAAFNADVVLSPGSLRKCTDDLMLDDSWGALGPMQVDLRGKLTHSGIFGTYAKPSFNGNWLKIPDESHRILRDDCVSISGSAYFVKRSVWNEMTECPIYRKGYPDVEGAFLPTLHYYEETYLSYHMAKHGYRVVYDGAVDMIHKWHTSSPVGGYAEQQTANSLAMFREACDLHGMEHE